MNFDWSSRSEEDVRMLGSILHDFLAQMATEISPQEWETRFKKVYAVQSRSVAKATNIDEERVELFLCELEAKELIKTSTG